MATQGQIPASARFGPFEISYDPPELRKYGYRLKLSGQALQVLLCLAEEPGRVVTREELQRELWPNAAYGDFEHGLNAAVNRLRETLDDSANEPKYIETIPRRGYRFIATFETETVAIEMPAQLTEVKAVPPAPINIVTQHRARWVAGAITGILILAVLSWYLWPEAAPKVLAIVPITHDGAQKADPVTDGERIYIPEGLGAHNWKLFQVSTAGGETLPSLPYTKPEPYEVSKDRSELLAGVDWDGAHKMEPEITIIPLPAGPPRRLGIFSTWAIWSPDEKEVIYASRHGAIYSTSLSGSNVRKLADVDGAVSYLRLSPDGTRIRFTLEDSARTRSELWEMTVDGRNLHPLFPSRQLPQTDCCGSWTPDGKYFVFQRVQNDGYFQRSLWAIRESRSLIGLRSPKPFPLTIGPLDWTTPIVSRDGSSLYAVGSQSRGELVRYDSRTKDFVPFLSGSSISELDFSRDGQWVTYVSTPNRVLWRSRIDGSERLQLTDTSIQTALPHWSPDGKQIAFMARAIGKPWKINLISAQGGAPREILSEGFNEVDPTWGPDSKSLAFGRLFESAERQAIYVVDLKTKKVTELPGSIGLFSPRWSPDGRYMAANQADLSRFMLFDFHTQTWAQWLPMAANFPVWSADSKSIYFDTVKSAEPAYCRAQVGSSSLESLFSLDSVPLFWGEWGTWSGIAPDDSGLVVRDASAKEIYALKMQWP